VNFLNSSEIASIKLNMAKAYSETKQAILLNAETNSSEQVQVLEAIKENLGVALDLVLLLNESDPDSFPDGAESHKAEAGIK
jgi:hypothetical protein